MDDLASAPAQRTSDDGGRIRDQTVAARKKTVKKPPPAPVERQDPEPELAREPEPDHQLDVLA